MQVFPAQPKGTVQRVCEANANHCALLSFTRLPLGFGANSHIAKGIAQIISGPQTQLWHRILHTAARPAVNGEITTYDQAAKVMVIFQMKTLPRGGADALLLPRRCLRPTNDETPPIASLH